MPHGAARTAFDALFEVGIWLRLSYEAIVALSAHRLAASATRPRHVRDTSVTRPVSATWSLQVCSAFGNVGLSMGYSLENELSDVRPSTPLLADSSGCAQRPFTV